MSFELPDLNTTFHQLDTGRIDTLGAFLAVVDRDEWPADEESWESFLAIFGLYEVPDSDR